MGKVGRYSYQTSHIPSPPVERRVVHHHHRPLPVPSYTLLGTICATNITASTCIGITMNITNSITMEFSHTMNISNSFTLELCHTQRWRAEVQGVSYSHLGGGCRRMRWWKEMGLCVKGGGCEGSVILPPRQGELLNTPPW